MAVSEDFKLFVLEQLGPSGRVNSRPMFGGVGLYLDGLFFALIDDDTLYFKTDDSNRARYERAGSRPFCPFPERPDKPMAYWQVPAEALEDAEELAVWAREAMNVALAARTKQPARRRAPARGRKGTRH
jgi:DNA transformation protein